MVCGSDGHFTKNALHLCAWKGDIQSMELLINTGKQYSLDLVNAISSGVGNYGKTCIFYAITQDRDDIVRYLIERGSNLLIVNNKGQTPSSLSIAHLTTETQNILFKEEACQLERGGQFINYRETHCDCRRYGDLDPRFPIDSYNWGRDIEEELGEVSAGNVPRCVRQTSAQSRMLKAMENRLKVPIDAPAVEASNHLPTKHQTASFVEMIGTTDPIEKNECLDSFISFEDLVYLNSSVNNRILVVQSFDDLQLFASYVDAFISQLNSHVVKNCFDLEQVQSSWALDCEWKPALSIGEENPVSILQLSTTSVSYILDLQLLCQPSDSLDRLEMTQSELLLNRILIKIFSDLRICIIGFDPVNDLERLAGSFPYIPCFQIYESVIDIRDLISRVSPTFSHRKNVPSLRKVVQKFIKKDMDKSLQCSDWSKVSSCNCKPYL